MVYEGLRWEIGDKFSSQFCEIPHSILLLTLPEQSPPTGQVAREGNYATQSSNKLTISTINPLNLPHGGALLREAEWSIKILFIGTD